MNILYYAAKAAVDEFPDSQFQEVQVSAFYEVSSQLIWLGDLTVRRFEVSDGPGQNVSTATTAKVPEDPIAAFNIE